MCFICIQLEKEKITFSKAREMLDEVSDVLDPEHYAEVSTKIWEESRKISSGTKNTKKVRSSSIMSPPDFIDDDENWNFWDPLDWTD